MIEKRVLTARNLKEIGSSIRFLRKQRKWTQDQLASKAKTSQVVVHKLESGKGVSLQTLLDVMQALRVEMEFREIKSIDIGNLSDLIP